MKQTKLNREIVRNYLDERIFSPRGQNDQAPYTGIDSVGVELELFPFQYDGEQSKVMRPVHVDKVIRALLKESEAFGGHGAYRHRDQAAGDQAQYDKIGFPNGSQLLFEPGGQVEICTPSCANIRQVREHLEFSQKILDNVCSRHGIHFGQAGLNPMFELLNEGNQLRKPRYLALQNYFDSIGPYGRQMMLQTCSLQINLDLGDSEEKQVKRILAANLLAPIATALFANSPRNEKGVFYKSYRSFLWQQLDATRTGILPFRGDLNQLTRNDLVDLYLDFLMQAPIVQMAQPGILLGQPFPTFKEWMHRPIGGISPNLEELENHLSLLFPEVRVRGYLEIRTVDAPPREWQMLPVAFYMALLYDPLALERTLDLLTRFDSHRELMSEAAATGMDSEIVSGLCKKLMRLAIDGFSCLPNALKEDDTAHKLRSFYEDFTCQNRSFSELYPNNFDD